MEQSLHLFIHGIDLLKSLCELSWKMSHLVDMLGFFGLFFFGAKDQTQCFVQARQTLYHLATFQPLMVSL
jgi:hypothetical protein